MEMTILYISLAVLAGPILYGLNLQLKERDEARKEAE